MIRKATLSDLDNIIEFTKPYYEESVHYKKLTYSEAACRRTLAGWLNHSHVIVVERDEIVGVGVVTIGQTCYEELEAEMNLFYVSKDYRGKGVSRLLAEAITEFAKLHKVRIIHASNMSGMEGNNDKLWINLFRKYGYQVIGTTLARIL